MSFSFNSVYVFVKAMNQRFMVADFTVEFSLGMSNGKSLEIQFPSEFSKLKYGNALKIHDRGFLVHIQE